MRIVHEMTFVRQRLARRKWWVEAERSGMVWSDHVSYIHYYDYYDEHCTLSVIRRTLFARVPTRGNIIWERTSRLIPL